MSVLTLKADIRRLRRSLPAANYLLLIKERSIRLRLRVPERTPLSFPKMQPNDSNDATTLHDEFTDSLKAENHAHMMAIYIMHYNFVRIHQTLKISPAMAAGVTDKLWEMSDMVKVLEDWEGRL